ncbi:MAG: glycosyltransferase [Oscillospiraceae bacterium]|nr:glycosyltransferase [Oscillospiraceae bacterium]
MEHLISIIVPAYNAGPWLSDCLDSIISQTYKNLEIIVIDDGSTDRTAQIIDEYVKKDNRIIAIHQPNAGLVAVREHGIELATGDYIGFVDADDTVQPDMYERLLSNALKYNADISHCGVSFVWPDGKTDAHYGTDKLLIQDNYTGLRDLLNGDNIEPSLCNKIYSKCIIKNSCIDTSVLNNEDILRNFTLFSRAEKSVYEDFCGYNYFQRQGSMSKDKSKAIESFRHIVKARKLILDNSSKEIFPFAMRLWLSTFVNMVNQSCFDADENIKNLCKECRATIKKEKSNIRYLIKRQQIAAYLIIYAPWLHKIVYKIYSGKK